jgi:hypothetical protein
VLLEVSTHPVLVEQLQASLRDALQAALDAHRYALNLDPENADALFNTAQVLTTIAEEISNDDDIPDTDALKLLEEAFELQTKCYSIQEMKYEESVEQERLANEQVAEMEPEVEAASSEQKSEQATTDADEEDQWFAVVEPVTHDTLIDTLVAQLNTLTTFCGILSGVPESAPPSTLPMIEEYSTKLVAKIPAIAQDKPERQQEIALSKANFVSALLEAGFKSEKVDAATYKRERDAAFAAAELSTSTSVESAMANARSLLSFNSALADAYSNDSSVRWNALTECIQQLTAASKIPGIGQSDLAATHLLRGDANLCLYALALPPTSHPTAISNAAQLVKHAEVFYRNASKLSGGGEEAAVAKLRSLVSVHLQHQVEKGSPFAIEAVVTGNPQGPQWALEQLEDMVAEGLLPQSIGL